MSSKTIPLGEVLDREEEYKKDAVHVAIAPIRARELLQPGAHVAVEDGEAFLPTGREKAVGVVDPFLKAPLQEGERSWCFVFPNTVKGLRHEWDHPSFPDEDPDEGWDGCRGC